MTDKINGTGSGNANYVQQDNNQIQNREQNPEIRNAQKSGSKLGLAVKIVATILTGGLFGIGWGIYSLVHSANKSQNTSPLNQNNTGVPGEKPINNEIIDNSKKTVIKNNLINEKPVIDEKEEAEIDNYQFKEPEEDSKLKFITGIEKKGINNELDEDFKYADKWMEIPEDLTQLDKKDSFLEGGIKGTSLEKPLRKMINGFFNFVGREKANKLVKNMLTWEEGRRIDVEKLSDNAIKALLVTASLRSNHENYRYNFYLEQTNDLRKQRDLLVAMEYSLNLMLYEENGKMDQLPKEALLNDLNVEIGDGEEVKVKQEIKEDEEENNNIEEENEAGIDEENPEEIEEDNNQIMSSNKGIFDSYESIQANFIDKDKYMGYLDASGSLNYEAVVPKNVKNYLMTLKNFGQESIDAVNKTNVLRLKDNTLQVYLPYYAIKIYNGVLSEINSDHAPIQAVLKSHGSTGAPEDANFAALLISKALQNPKNAEFFAEGSDKELHGIEFLKMLTDEVDALLDEGRNLLKNDPYYVSGKPDDEDDE